MIDRIRKEFEQNQLFMESFSKIYLFGSILSLSNPPNDIDILLVYEEVSDNIISDSELISLKIQECTHINVDLTILSRIEFIETSFLDRLKDNYLEIK